MNEETRQKKMQLLDYIQKHGLIVPAEVYRSLGHAVNDGILDFDDTGAIIQICDPVIADADEAYIGHQGSYIRLEPSDIIEFYYISPEDDGTSLWSGGSDVLLYEDQEDPTSIFTDLQP